jgi:hypothetical protein
VKKLLAHKRLAWRAVEQPTIMPKPQLLPLTGAGFPPSRCSPPFEKGGQGGDFLTDPRKRARRGRRSV